MNLFQIQFRDKLHTTVVGVSLVPGPPLLLPTSARSHDAVCTVHAILVTNDTGFGLFGPGPIWGGSRSPPPLEIVRMTAPCRTLKSNPHASPCASFRPASGSTTDPSLASLWIGDGRGTKVEPSPISLASTASQSNSKPQFISSPPLSFSKRCLSIWVIVLDLAQRNFPDRSYGPVLLSSCLICRSCARLPDFPIA
jgi:hypothetical protein